MPVPTPPMDHLDLATLGAMTVTRPLSVRSRRRAAPRVRPAIRRRLTLTERAIAALQRRRQPKKDTRLLRFVVRVGRPVSDLKEITKPIQAAMLAGRRLPDSHLANNLRCRPLFPNAPAEKVTRLRDYYVVTAPVSYASVLRRAKKRNGAIWDLAYSIRKADPTLFELVEPDVPAAFYMRTLSQDSVPGCTVGPKEAPVDANGEQDVGWARRMIRVDNLTLNGRNIRIGHIDTGHTQHAELNRTQTHDLNADRDIVSQDDSAVDPLTDGNSGHGTATASLITSQHGTTWTDANDQPRPGISGVAPDATIVSTRAIESVVAIGNVDVAEAIWHCINEKVHVITMSLGGYANPWLQAVIAHAVHRENIIVTAAAGNCWPFVIFPAAYPEVIACGGVGLHPTTGSPRIWTGSASGSAVDICAPAENVYVADFDALGRQIVAPGEGTSFASPHVAGVAALWLEKHGRDQLLQTYGNSNACLADVFRAVIQSTAQTGNGWDTAKYGAGILDARGALNAVLPAPSAFNAPDFGQWKPFGPEDVLYHMFEASQDPQAAIETVLNATGQALADLMDWVGAEVNQLIGCAKEAWEDFSEAAAGAVSDAVEDVAEAVEDFVDDVVDQASDTLSTVAGWFGI